MAEARPQQSSQANLEVVDQERQEVRRRKPFLRVFLLWVVPLLAVTAGIKLYLDGGRFIATENAYVKSDKVLISPEVSGTVVEMSVQDNDWVEPGDVLFRLRDDTYRIAVARAEAALNQARIEIDSDKIAYEQALQEIELNESDVQFATTQFKRQQELRRNDLGTIEDLDRSRYELDAATKRVQVSTRHAAHLLTRLANDTELPADAHPNVLEALAVLDQAQLDLARTVVTAPFAGVVTNMPRPGDYIEKGRPSLALVSHTDMWVEANYKETQLTHVAVGQPVTVSIDTYPDERWRGEVQSIAEATGAEFALLPPQNATGNWVKIVQRIPVKIRLKAHAGAPALRMGMSAEVEIDTGFERSWHDLIPDW